MLEKGGNVVNIIAQEQYSSFTILITPVPLITEETICLL